VKKKIQVETPAGHVFYPPLGRPGGNFRDHSGQKSRLLRELRGVWNPVST
jgi:hypothetical protein